MMSILVKGEDGKLSLYSKGADEVLGQRLTQPYEEDIQSKLNEYSN